VSNSILSQRALEQIARALFKEWFVEGDEDDGEIGTLENLVNITTGKRPLDRSDFPTKNINIPLYGGNGPMGYVHEALYNEPIILTGRVGTLGTVFRIKTACWPSDNTLILLAKDVVDYEFVYFQIQQIDIHSLNRGSTQPLLTQGDLKTQPVKIPPKQLLKKFHNVVTVLFEKIDANIEQSRTLTALRDALLPKLMSGEVRVEDAETELKMAMRTPAQEASAEAYRRHLRPNDRYRRK